MVQTLKGFRDFLPADMTVRLRVKKILTEVFESYGFEPLETPSLEYKDVLLGKYGPEADKLVYTFKDNGGRDVGLRYDLTVPLARVAATYSTNLNTPFKRYQIQKVWRAENTQKGRYREIEQCDIDILNTTSPLADADILTVIDNVLSRLSLPPYEILINTRPLLFAMMLEAGISDKKLKEAAISVDKLDKMTEEDVKKEMVEIRSIKVNEVNKLFDISAQLMSSFSNTAQFIETDTNTGYKLIDRELNILKEIVRHAVRLGANPSNITPRFTLARGLDYYTGVVFETVIKEPRLGSITGGGRYDNLISTLGGPDWPAVGTAFGLDRICDIITQTGVWSDITKSATQVLVTVFSESELVKSIHVVKLLRDSGVNADIYYEVGAKLDKQLKYADKRGIPWAVVIGPEEAKEDLLVLKNLRTNTQEKMPYTDIAAKIR